MKNSAIRSLHTSCALASFLALTSCAEEPDAPEEIAPAQLTGGFTAADLGLAFDVERAPVLYAQLLVHTCDVTDAGTDDDTFVQLTASPDDRVYLNNGHDDHDRNDWDWHGFYLPVTKRLSDITELTLGRAGGSDGWCFDHVQLKVNGQIMFDQGVAPTWVDADGQNPPTFSFGWEALRGSPSWAEQRASGGVCRLPTVTPSSDIENVAEGTLGHIMLKRSNGRLPGVSIPGAADIEKYLKWGGKDGARYVEFTPRDGGMFNIDFDLEASVTTTPEVDLDVNIGLACENGVLSVRGERPHVAAGWDGPFAWLGNWIMDILNGFVADAIGGLSYTFRENLVNHIPQHVRDLLGQAGIDPAALACPQVVIEPTRVVFHWAAAIENLPLLCVQ